MAPGQTRGHVVPARGLAGDRGVSALRKQAKPSAETRCGLRAQGRGGRSWKLGERVQETQAPLPGNAGRKRRGRVSR